MLEGHFVDTSTEVLPRQWCSTNPLKPISSCRNQTKTQAVLEQIHPAVKFSVQEQINVFPAAPSPELRKVQ